MLFIKVLCREFDKCWGKDCSNNHSFYLTSPTPQSSGLPTSINTSSRWKASCNSPVFLAFNLSTIESTRAYHDHIHAFKIRKKLFLSPDISALFACRDPPYKLRRFNTRDKNTHASEYAYSASVPRFRKLQYMLRNNA